MSQLFFTLRHARLWHSWGRSWMVLLSLVWMSLETARMRPANASSTHSKELRGATEPGTGRSNPSIASASCDRDEENAKPIANRTESRNSCDCGDGTLESRVGCPPNSTMARLPSLPSFAPNPSNSPTLALAEAETISAMSGQGSIAVGTVPSPVRNSGPGIGSPNFAPPSQAIGRSGEATIALTPPPSQFEVATESPPPAPQMDEGEVASEPPLLASTQLTTHSDVGAFVPKVASNPRTEDSIHLADALEASPNLPQAAEPPTLADANLLGQPEAVTPPRYEFQGAYIYQGDEESARARISGIHPLSPNALVGGAVDVTDGTAFADSQIEGFSINELYLAASLPNLPNLRFVLGQLDLTSYFDRNSFAKDGATHFFNSVFQTNPALSRTGISSRTGLLANWSVTDDIEAKVAGFSSSRRLDDFRIDGFAAEVGVRAGTAIVRATYASDRDAGVDDGFREIFQIPRGDGGTGLQSDDREQAYGVNAEVFIPELGLGLFGRYGRYENLEIDEAGETFSGGINLLDLFVANDRLGVGYGRELSNDRLRQDRGDEIPDVFEFFYDVPVVSNVRVGFSVQSFNEFSDTILWVRVRTVFDATPPVAP